MAKTSKKKKLSFTDRQLAVARLMADPNKGHGMIKQTLLDLGYSESTASNPTMLWTSQGVQEALHALGINPQTILAPAIDAFSAKQTATYRGEVIESEIPDHKTRLQAAESLAKISGILKDTPTVNMNSLTVQPSDMQNFDFDI